MCQAQAISHVFHGQFVTDEQLERQILSSQDPSRIPSAAGEGVHIDLKNLMYNILMVKCKTTALELQVQVMDWCHQVTRKKLKLCKLISQMLCVITGSN